ncbi:hypothetical protein D3C85_1211200 [compost metagenome]
MSIVAVAHHQERRVFRAARQALHEWPAAIQDGRALHRRQPQLHRFQPQAVHLVRVALHQPGFHQAARQPVSRGAVQAGGLSQCVQQDSRGVMLGDLLEQAYRAKHRLRSLHVLFVTHFLHRFAVIVHILNVGDSFVCIMNIHDGIMKIWRHRTCLHAD